MADIRQTRWGVRETASAIYDDDGCDYSDINWETEGIRYLHHRVARLRLKRSGVEELASSVRDDVKLSPDILEDSDDSTDHLIELTSE